MCIKAVFVDVKQCAAGGGIKDGEVSGIKRNHSPETAGIEVKTEEEREKHKF